MTQSVIVYRNPMEAAFWEGGFAFPLIAAVFVGVMIFVIAHLMFDKYNRGKKYGRRQWQPTTLQNWMSGFIAVAAAVVVFLALLA